jgi:hypothetical protein
LKNVENNITLHEFCLQENPRFTSREEEKNSLRTFRSSDSQALQAFEGIFVKYMEN